MGSETSRSRADALNESCQCISVDEGLLREALLREALGIGLEQLAASHPHLFSRSAVFADAGTLEAMAGVIAAIERIVALPAYQAQALAGAHPHARVETAARGAFLGFDFHVAAGEPKLIEINTNAGGGLLNGILRSAQRACCAPVAEAFRVDQPAEDPFGAMLEAEWRLARGARELHRIAIVDDAPEQQYLYPEFVLFQRMLERRGHQAKICDARELALAGGRLEHRGQAIDLVYNRLTDFALARPEHAALAEAFRRDLAVVTPHPRAHALYADKRRLAVLCDAARLRELGASGEDAERVARHVPQTRVVTPELRDELWRERKRLFFKPQTGYGGRAAWRGDKITRRVFEEIFGQPYVAQALVPPSARRLRVGQELTALKLDLRNFAYAGRVQLVCARLYTGQTTNFRSEGGGFAPVYPA
jgi:hypothetical protein